MTKTVDETENPQLGVNQAKTEPDGLESGPESRMTNWLAADPWMLIESEGAPIKEADTGYIGISQVIGGHMTHRHACGVNEVLGQRLVT